MTNEELQKIDLLTGPPPANAKCHRCGNFARAYCAFKLYGPRQGEACGKPLCEKHGVEVTGLRRYCMGHARLAGLL
jgi:hypothetical protein